MRTVRDACDLHENALRITLSDQIEQLDELITMEGDGSEYFKKTFITHGMDDLISEGIARLAGASSQAIFHLKQAMGGGKTHLLVGFGLLAKNRALRQIYCAGIAHNNSFNDAKIAAFNGRNNPDHFFWGEIAQQLGDGAAFAQFWTAGPKAPDETAWLKLFTGLDPILILLDEMPPYFQYYDTQKVGNGTVADIATRAFANLLTAAGKKSNVCIVVSDLAASYDTGGRLINKALEDARSELGRQERNITPVDLAANEIYDILRKRLFVHLPNQAEIDDISAAFGRKLEEATKSKTVNRGAESIADEIASTYPFHPRLKNVIALFKENEHFKQTRGLIELASRLLRSVWERSANDIFLIGPQHFDLSIQDVRDKLTEISGMRDVIAKDLWDSEQSAHAQIIDLQSGKEATCQVGALLLTASLSTAVNAVKGLTREEMVECLINPLREPSEFLTSFDEFEKSAWYLHHTPEGRFYFDRQENLTKLLQSLAQDAPANQVDDLIRHRLKEMFKATRRTIYDEVLPLPKLDDIADRVRRGRVLLVVSPDTKIPPEEVQKFFAALSQKNNLCVLTGDKTAMASLEKAARQLYAVQKADTRIAFGHPQRADLEAKQETYAHDFTATILGLFDKVFFPIQRPGRDAELRHKPLDLTRDSNKPFNGEEQIEKTLTADPLKLHLDVENEFEAIRDKAQDLLWPENVDETRWSDAIDRYADQAGMYWLPPKGLDTLKSLACNKGLWEDLGNGYITKKPKKKTTSVQIIPETEPDDQGNVRLRLTALNAGPIPKILYEEDGRVTESSSLLPDQHLTTSALRVTFLTTDPSGQYSTGEPVQWVNQLVLRTALTEDNDERTVALFVAPRGEIRYSLDGTEPREGTIYCGPFAIGDSAIRIQVFAQAEGLEAKREFTFPAKHQKGTIIDPNRPGKIIATGSGRKLDSRLKTFEGLTAGAAQGGVFQGVHLTIGQGTQMIAITVGEVPVEASFLEELLNKACEKFGPDSPITMTFRNASFTSGYALKEFIDQLGIEINPGDVEQ